MVTIEDGLIKQWIELQENGETEEAQKLYDDEIFDKVIDRFVDKYRDTIPGVEVLFSVLGYTPEPIILTHRALKPKKHIIFTTQNVYGQAKYLYEKYIKSEPVVSVINEPSFGGIYEAMMRQLDKNPARKYALDITGGKKSMVASAAIFGRDFGFNILYVDYIDYREKIRRPVPGTEILDLVYSPERDLPEANFNLQSKDV